VKPVHAFRQGVRVAMRSNAGVASTTLPKLSPLLISSFSNAVETSHDMTCDCG
jgi:hypothetical protein